MLNMILLVFNLIKVCQNKANTDSSRPLLQHIFKFCVIWSVVSIGILIHQSEVNNADVVASV